MNIHLSTALRCPAALWQDATLPGFGRWRPRSVLMVLCGVVFLATVPWGSAYYSRNAALERELAILEAHSAVLAGQWSEAKYIQPEFTTLLEQPRRIVNALSAKGWTPLLRVVIQSLTGDIQLRDISVRQMADGEGAHLMRLEGIAMGRSPRIVADQFRSALERGLEGEHSGPVKTQFERLEDAEVPTIGSAPAQADFTITISLGPEPLTGDGGGGT